MLNDNLGPVAVGWALPSAAPFDPVAVQAKALQDAARAPRDPLSESEPDNGRESPVEPFDHGSPFADIAIGNAA